MPETTQDKSKVNSFDLNTPVYTKTGIHTAAISTQVIPSYTLSIIMVAKVVLTLKPSLVFKKYTTILFP